MLKGSVHTYVHVPKHVGSPIHQVSLMSQFDDIHCTAPSVLIYNGDGPVYPHKVLHNSCDQGEGSGGISVKSTGHEMLVHLTVKGPYKYGQKGFWASYKGK